MKCRSTFLRANIRITILIVIRINCELNRVFEYTNCEVREDTGIIRMNIFDEQSVQNMFPCIRT